MAEPSKLRCALAIGASLCFGTACDPELADLVARILTQPGAMTEGDSIALTTEVCNEGIDPAGPTFLEFLLREEGDHTTALPIGARPVPALAQGECDSDETWVTIPFGTATGAYEIVGLADPEMDLEELTRWNNIARTAAFGVGWAPDLVVEDLGHDPAVEKNQPFAVHMQVCNRGLDWAGPSQVMVLLSLDDVISIEPPGLPDWVAGFLDAPDLAPGACAPVSGSVSASSDEGALHVGALADYSDVVPETVESNNGAVAGPIGVGFGPDLVVESVSGPPSALPGSWIELAVRICNQGTDSAPDVWASLHLSDDAVITPGYPDPAAGDPQVGSLYVGHLDAGACDEQTVGVNVPYGLSSPVFLGAYADDPMSVPELVESNNGLAGPPLGVGTGPDLIVTSLDAPPSADGSFDVDVEVCNVGTAGAPPAILLVALSTDESYAPPPEGDDPDVGVLFLAPLEAGACRTEMLPAWVSVPGTVPENGPYWLVAVVDPLDDLEELIESNNQLFGSQIGVGSGPDLIVTDVSGPPSADGPFEAWATVCNQGTVWASGMWLTFYHSPDPVIGGSPGAPWGPGPPDFPAGDLPVPDLEPGACVEVHATSLSASTPDPGAWYLGAFVDDWDAVAELIETNNALAGPLMGIGSGPDLVVTRVLGPPSALPGASVALDVQVCNQGTQPAGGTDTHLYASQDGVIQGLSAGPMASDSLLTIFAVPPLAAGSCFDTLETASLPSEAVGLLTLGGIVDEYDDVWDELIESNNTHAGSQLAVGAEPDLIVEGLSGDPSALPGSTASLEATVCNQGTVASNWTDLSLYLSEDTEIEGSYFEPGEDPFLDFHPVPPLAPGGCTTLAVDTYLWAPDGAWYLGAIVNEGGYLSELRHDNNDFVGDLIGVGLGPDLVVTSLVVPPLVQTGVEFPVDATVCNQGTDTAWGSDVAFYHSADATLVPVPQNPANPDLPLAWMPVGTLPPGACELVSAVVVPPLPGSWHLGAYVDESDATPELIETNNDRMAPPHEVE